MNRTDIAFVGWFRRQVSFFVSESQFARCDKIFAVSESEVRVFRGEVMLLRKVVFGYLRHSFVETRPFVPKYVLNEI